MNAEVKMNEAATEQLTEQNKVVALFQFIEELNKLKQKSVINVNDYKIITAGSFLFPICLMIPTTLLYIIVTG